MYIIYMYVLHKYMHLCIMNIIQEINNNDSYKIIGRYIIILWIIYILFNI